MDDVASAHSENLNLRKIQQKLLQWEKKECSLSHLTQHQLNAIDQLNECLQHKSAIPSREVVSVIKTQSKISNEMLIIFCGSAFGTF